MMTCMPKSFVHQRVLFIGTLGLCFFLAVGVEGYYGTRYGKREPNAELMEGLGRFSAGRLGGPRSIVARSTGARFYAGTRYAGKRSYWDSPFIEGEERGMRGRDPVDCVYLPYFGLRCFRNEEPAWGSQMKWNAGNTNGEEVEESPSVNSETTGTSNA